MDTNANSKIIGSLLADARNGTFTGLITTKVGTVKGGVRYDDDTVHTVIITGFSYERLVKRSLEALKLVTVDDICEKLTAKNITYTRGDVEQALAEVEVSLTKSAAGTNEATTDAVFEPLIVDGEAVRGSRVYKCQSETGKCNCRDCTGDPKAPLKGTIYLQGLRIWSEVLTPAKNGKAPAPNSSAKTLAKNEIQKRLPVSKYVSYRLEPGTDFILRAGGTAAVEATTAGFIVTDDIVAALAA